MQRNQVGHTEDARITEVTETYQKGEETIEATFGDSLPTLVDQIRKVR